MRKAQLLVCLCAAFSLPVAAAGSGKEFSDRNPRYRLQPLDVLEIQYRYTPEYNQTISIQPDGYSELLLVGDLKLEGLTLDEARTAILQKAAARLRDPEVNLILKEYEKPYIVIGGEVTSPGRFEMRGHITAIEAVAMAGGFKNSAKHSQVILFRRVSPDLAKTQVLDMKEMMKHPDEDVVLRPGDMLLVPQNEVSKIERFVKWGSMGVYWNPVHP